MSLNFQIVLARITATGGKDRGLRMKFRCISSVVMVPDLSVSMSLNILRALPSSCRRASRWKADTRRITT